MFPPQAGERLIHVDHVARRLGVSERTVRNLAAKDEIPGFKIGPKLWRFRPQDIDAMVRRGMKEAHQ